jgi:proprotein convertase subtilisin/kexin type 5
MKKILYFFLLINFNDYIKCDNKICFEYSCEECETEQYGKCTKCREGFILIDGTCPCLDSSCALCDKKSSNFQKCYQCKNGYYNDDSKCYCALENCDVCGEFGCLKCNYGYYYNTITEECEKINCHDDKCRLCFSHSENTCFLCKEGYSLSSGKCNPNTGSNDNIGDCPVMDSSFCYKKCNDNIWTEEQKENWETYCLECRDDISYTNDNCENSELCNIDGCKVCRTDGKCYKCRQGYRFDNGNCLKCPKGCSKCRTNDKCDYCFSGYHLNSDMQCILSNTFDFDINIYKSKKKALINKYYPEIYISEELSPNIECDKNCKKCYDNTGVCKECKTNYNLVGNKCIYECSSPNCICKIPDCEKCSNKKPNSCTKCKNGRQLIDGRCWNIANNCQDNIPECILCNGHDKCYSCSDKYILNEEKDVCKKKNKCCFNC